MLLVYPIACISAAKPRGLMNNSVFHFLFMLHSAMAIKCHAAAPTLNFTNVLNKHAKFLWDVFGHWKMCKNCCFNAFATITITMLMMSHKESRF